jgi:hypothetical protein
MTTKLICSISLALVTILAGCATQVGKVSFPQPSASFTPKQTYTMPYDKLWDATINTLDKNRISTVSTDKAGGAIQTDYIEGQSSLIGLGVVAAQNTRYKYNLALRKQADDSVKLNILCKIDSTMTGSAGSSQWHDVTGQNAALAKKLETWLYEEIEKGL